MSSVEGNEFEARVKHNIGGEKAATNEKYPPSCERHMSLSEMVQKLECANECLRKRLCELECRYTDLHNENSVLKKMVRESC